jgi:hypothetical protein
MAVGTILADTRQLPFHEHIEKTVRRSRQARNLFLMNEGGNFLASGRPDEVEVPIDMPESRARLIDSPDSLTNQPAHDVHQEAFDRQADLVAGKGDAKIAQVALDAGLIRANDEIVNRILGAG